MIQARDMLKARLHLRTVEYEIRNCQFVEGGKVLFVSGLAAPLCGTCGQPFSFRDIRFEKIDLADLPVPQARELLLIHIEQKHRDDHASKAPE